MASCMECIHFNPCNMHSNIIVEKPTEGNDWGLHNEVEKECKYFTPTADVVEVKHSRWENISGFDVCNICGTSPAYCEPKPNNPKGYPPYCHNCGAKMDGGKAG